MTKEISFKSPGFSQRIKSMLGVDFYRLFHTPMFYIFLAIAAIIPAMIIGTGGMKNAQTGEISPQLYTNVWHIIAATKPLYVVSDISQYANMNMVFIFGGIMVSVFVGHDYKSGYVKQLFTTHSKKQDYMFIRSHIDFLAGYIFKRNLQKIFWHINCFELFSRYGYFDNRCRLNYGKQFFSQHLFVWFIGVCLSFKQCSNSCYLYRMFNALDFYLQCRRLGYSF